MNNRITESTMDEGYTLLESPQCVPDLWFEDGSLVLQAETSLFRIHKSVISAKSSVFKDMLLFPQPNNEELYEGCPLVRIHDTAADTSFFLKAIYDPAFFEPPPTKTELKIVAGVIRLSTKYDVQFLRRRALAHLATACPTSLETWDPRQTSSTITVDTSGPRSYLAISLAREVDVPWILPALLYACSTYPVEHILDGMLWDDSRLAMSWEDKRMCLITRETLRNFQTEQIDRFLRLSDAHGCTSPDSCRNVRSSWLDVAISEKHPNPLNRWTNSDWAGYAHEVCPTCFAISKHMHHVARKTLWDQLPELYGLRSWAELTAVKAAALE